MNRLPHCTPDELLAAIRAEITPQDWAEITRAAIDKAKQGDKDTRNWLAEYTLPKASADPSTADDLRPIQIRWPDELEKSERENYQTRFPKAD